MEQIRQITSADESKIADIIRTNLKTYHLDIPGTAYYDPELEHLSEYYNAVPDKRAYFVAEDDTGRIIGGVGIAEFSAIESCAEIQKLYLSDAAKGKGLGRRLLEYAEKQARQMGFERLYLETHSSLVAAIRLYEKLGYREIEKPDFIFHSTMDLFYVKSLVTVK